MVNKILNWYSTLPKGAQSLLITLEAAVVGFAITYYEQGQFCLQSACLKKFAAGMGTVIFAALFNWLRSSPIGQQFNTIGQLQQEERKLKAKAAAAGASKLTAILLCAALLFGVTPITGCNQQDVSRVVTNIGIYASEAAPLINSALQLVALFGNSSDAQSVQQLTPFVNQMCADLKDLSALTDQYKQGTGKAAVWNTIVGTVDNLVSNSDQTLLHVGGIKNPDSQKRVQVVLASVNALLHIIDGLVQSTQSPEQVKAKAKARAARLSQVSAYWSPDDKARISEAFHAPYQRVYQTATANGF